MILAVGDLVVPALLPFRRQRRNAAVFRIDDERGAVVERTALVPELVVGNAGAGRPRFVLVEPLLHAVGERLALVFAEHRLVARLAEPLERRRGGVAPDALKIRITPRRLGGLPGLRRRRARGRLPGHRDWKGAQQARSRECADKPARIVRHHQVPLAHSFFTMPRSLTKITNNLQGNSSASCSSCLPEEGISRASYLSPNVNRLCPAAI